MTHDDQHMIKRYDKQMLMLGTQRQLLSSVLLLLQLNPKNDPKLNGNKRSLDTEEQIIATAETYRQSSSMGFYLTPNMSIPPVTPLLGDFLLSFAFKYFGENQKR